MPKRKSPPPPTIATKPELQREFKTQRSKTNLLELCRSIAVSRVLLNLSTENWQFLYYLPQQQAE
jgi:hypothetical protein